MDAAALKSIQAPLKARYADDPAAALITLTAEGDLDGTGIACRVRTARAVSEAGLHPATGGDGSLLCSGDMLLEALVACAGVTLRAVATALGLDVVGRVHAAGDLDFRGTLGMRSRVGEKQGDEKQGGEKQGGDERAPVGFREIRLRFELDTTAGPNDVATLLKLTERYCVVLQTLTHSPTTTVRVQVTERDQQ